MQHNRSRIALVALSGLLCCAALCAPTMPPASPAVDSPAIPAPAKTTLLLFTQEGCPPCRVLESSLQDPAVKALIVSRFVLSEVRPPDARYEQYGVNGTPTLIALIGDNPRKIGSMNAAELLAWLKSIHAAKAAAPRRPRRPGGSAKIVEAGPYDGPDGRQVMIDYPSEMWRENITSRGEGCCVQRTVDFQAHWQNVPALWAFPEWVRQTGRPGGAYADLLTKRISAICKDRGMTVPDVLNVESKDFALVKMILATGRLVGVDYTGQDGVHYGVPIAHCVALSYADDDYVCILDNNFPVEKSLWMPTAEFDKRWPGWIIALLAPRPPAPPHN